MLNPTRFREPKISTNKRFDKEFEEENEMIEKILKFPNYKITNLNKNLCAVNEPRNLLPAKKAVYVPLTPIQIYRIHISPTSFNFGKV